MSTNSTSNFLPSEYQQYIHLSRYSKFIWNEERRETWPETVSRYFAFFTDHLEKKHRYVLSEAERSRLEGSVLGLSVMPSMRALMTAGPALSLSHVAGYNCSFVAVDNKRVFDEILYVLMNGTGVGFSVEQLFVSKLPKVAKTFRTIKKIIRVKDSKQGWARAYRVLVRELYKGNIPSWDVSAVRPAGAPLRTFGGRASGPEPLISLFEFTVDLFKRAAGRKLTSIECHDLVCKIAEIVVVGGVRRSALISLSDLEDGAMRVAKSGTWWEDNVQRALANNSVAYKEKPDLPVFQVEWQALIDSQSGERGIFNREAARKQAMNTGRRDPNHHFGTNPCVTGDTWVLTDRGPRQVRDLLEEPFNAIVEGRSYPASAFWSTGVKPVYELKTTRGYSVKLTADHKVLTRNRGWVEAQHLMPEDEIAIGDNRGVGWSDDSDAYTDHTKLASLDYVGDFEVFDCTVDEVHAFDANGIIVHNCGEISLRSKQFCNLTEVVIRPTDTLDTLLEKVRVATILGTFQATLVDFPYLSREWRRNCEEERLLGVSLTGIMDHEVTSGSKGDELLSEWLTTMRAAAVETNREWSARLGINQAAAITCGKPSGTVSQLVDASSGIHARYDRYYIRRVRADKKDPLATMMVEMGFPVEDDVTKPDHTYVFSFPIKSPEHAIFRDQVTAKDQLKLWLLYKNHWCEHSQSVTIYVKPEEWDDIGAFVYENFDDISGVSFLPFSDHVYKQAPYEELTEEGYHEMLAKMPKNVDWSALRHYENTDMSEGAQSLACVAGGCEL